MSRRCCPILLVACIFVVFANCEPDYCKRGAKISEAYQHCFEEARVRFPYQPLSERHDVFDGCMVEAYANHTCSVVKQSALECFRRNVRYCSDKERLVAIADESGGACHGNRINREFKEHILDHLDPVRGDSSCFMIADRVYECYSQAGMEMVQNNPNLQLLSVDDYMTVANQFFDTIYNCFIAIYKSNAPLCENWQIPLLLEIQGTALPSLFGMHFTPQQMDRLELRRGCPTHHRRYRYGYAQAQTSQRVCNISINQLPDNNSNGGGGHGGSWDHQQIQQQVQQQQEETDTVPPFIQRLREQVQQRQQQWRH